jgi:hypothetical protein
MCPGRRLFDRRANRHTQSNKGANSPQVKVRRAARSLPPAATPIAKNQTTTYPTVTSSRRSHR